jgi:hypothetical protein
MGTRRWIASAVVAAGVFAAHGLTATSPRFYPDDPLLVEPDSQDASQVAARDIDLAWDLATNLLGRPGDDAVDVKAGNVNTIDEVPDSSWFTNRILVRPLALDDLARGPAMGRGPAPGRWTVSHPKTEGFAPGFRIRDTQGATWFVSLDPTGYDESATGALMVANRIFWALGYWQVENHLVRFASDDLDIAPTAELRVPSGRKRPMRRSDLDAVLARAARENDGRYRAVAARALPGRVVGGFEYHGTRSDDPNDIVPHEHRRELRALKVFGAWTNLVDMKAGNTLDVVVPGPDGRFVVRHYLQDVGSTFGTGATGPREFDEGWEPLVDGPASLRRLLTFGLALKPWQTVRYTELPSIGRFEGDRFDPRTWRPRVPPSAFHHARWDDTFWAARRVAAFSDEAIRTVVRTAEYSDPRAAAHLADVLIKRRDAIARAYLPAITPLVDFTLDAAGPLTFVNAAEAAGVAAAPADGYRIQWARFDNATGVSMPLGGRAIVREPRAIPSPSLPRAPGTFVQASVSLVDPGRPEWARPVTVTFVREHADWRLVGLDRYEPWSGVAARGSRSTRPVATAAADR